MNTEKPKEWKYLVPPMFAEGKEIPTVSNVRELIKMLNLLPPSLPIRGTFNGRVGLVVYNLSDGGNRTHLSIEDIDA